nr:hypothetical protein [Micromonospora sp. DSM 115978]
MSTVNARTPLEAMVQRGFLASGWPWRSLAYATSSVPPVLVAAVPLAVIGLPWLVALAWVSDGWSC